MRALLALAALAAARALRADAGLEAEFQSELRAQAASLSCAAQILGNPLRALAPGWTVAPPEVLPPLGSWQALAVAVHRGGESRVLSVQVRLWPCQRAEVLRRSLPAGAPVGDQDLSLAWVDTRSVGGLAQQGPVPAGSRLARPRCQGDPLLRGDLVQAPSRRAGDKVELRIHFSGGTASDEGFLLEDAAEGAEIKAEHARSGRVVTGRLHGGAVLVED
jgi:flagella basal body P-ring formation protein FlgA